MCGHPIPGLEHRLGNLSLCAIHIVHQMRRTDCAAKESDRCENNKKNLTPEREGPTRSFRGTGSNLRGSEQ
jgi:hypothetical protein